MCTYLNTVLDWCNMKFSRCEMCNTQNEEIKLRVAMAKKQKKSEAAPEPKTFEELSES